MGSPESDLTAIVSRPLGPYRLVSRLGEGGMGVVHLALDPSGAPVAAKVLRPHVAGDEMGRARLAREVATLRRVRGPRVAEVLDADVEAPEPYIVTRYVPGPSLDKVVRERGRLSPRALFVLAEGLADALCSLGAVGVVHRDLKPGNVLLHDAGPVLIDFGIARLADDSSLTASGLLVGTPGYLPPEVVAGERATAASDVYSLAATLAYAATGRPPFGQGSFDVVLANISRGVIDLHDVHAPFADLLRPMLAADPAARPTATEVRERAAAALACWPPHANGQAGEDERPTDVVATPPAATRILRPSDSGQSLTPARTQQAAAPQALQQQAPAGGRTVVTAAAYAAIVALAAVLPVAAFGLLVVVLLLLRTVNTTWRELTFRRMTRGRHWSNAVVATLMLPWRAVVAAIATTLTLALASFAAAGAFVFAWLATGSANGPAPPAAATAVGALQLWWGPGSSAVRQGWRLTTAKLMPSRRAVMVGTLLLVGLAILAVAGALSVPEADWWPLTTRPGDAVARASAAGSLGDFGPLSLILQRLVNP